ncbi:isochorismate synthase [Nonomuraea polychroma]|uniref:isochorismate synthase n=1 Tax=Nonomuraea polychroma TaxID=46176 RepID=UPI003D91A533
MAAPLIARTVQIPDPGDLIARIPIPSGLAWVRHGDGLVGWGEAARVLVPPGADRFAWARDRLTDLFGRMAVEDGAGEPGSGPVAFCAFTFDPDATGSIMIVPSTILVRRSGRAWLTSVGTAASIPAAPVRPPVGVTYEDDYSGAVDWMRSVEKALAVLGGGRLDKVVLARSLSAFAAEPLDPRALLTRLAARFPGCYTFACDGLVGATPELLVRRTRDHVESLVLAGSTRRGRDHEEDAALAAALVSSAKDRAEHAHAADSVRAALQELCVDLRADTEPHVLPLANVQHLATAVSGRLSAHRGVLDVAAALHPTPAVCGTPPGPAMELIRELEPAGRERYAGPVGWIDAAGNGEFGIALRCAEVHDHRARLYAGCGIVAGSDPAAELAETRLKFEAMQYAIGADPREEPHA